MKTKTYDGQTARFLASIATCMPQLTDKAMQGWIDNPQGLKKALQCLNLIVATQVENVLKFRDEIHVGPLRKNFIPDEFFTARKGIYLWNDMKLVLKNAQVVDSSEAVTLRSFDLTQNAYDSHIKTELSKDHEVELWQIAELIDAQKNGENGPLLINGHANIFYISGYVVRVHWHAYDQEWDVNDWELDSAYWREGCHIFSGN